MTFSVLPEWFRRRREADAAAATRGLTLEDAIPDAKLLIAFASTQTPKTERQLIGDLVNAIGKVMELVEQKKPVAAPVEAEFWEKYQNLAEELLPVTATTIRASSSAWNWGVPITTYALAAVLLLMVFVAVLATWVTGSTIRAEVKLASKDLQEKTKTYREARAKAVLVNSQLVELDEELTERPAKAVRTQAATADLQRKILDKKEELRKLSNDLGPMQSEVRSINLRREPLIGLLEEWYETATWKTWPVKTRDGIKEAMEAMAEDARRRADQESTTKRYPISRQVDSISWVNRVQEAKDMYAIDLIQRVDLILEVLQRYTLPLLLGLLGALTYILRTQIAQVKAQTFHRPFWSLSIARLGLGLIAGLVGGLVITSDDTVLKTLPPLALPFILGYAIEVLFAFMDKLVKSFVGDEKGARPA